VAARWQRPHKKGQLKDRPAAGLRGRKIGPELLDTILFFLFFLFLFFPIKRGISPKKGARAADGRRGRMLTYTARAVDVGRVPPGKQARGNEINKAKRGKIGFAPVDLLYSESLTKSTKKFSGQNL
jgi:hypothetical protein